MRLPGGAGLRNQLRKRQQKYGAPRRRAVLLQPLRQRLQAGMPMPRRRALANGFCHNGCLNATDGFKEELLMSSDLIRHTTDAEFEQHVVQSSTPVLVDFWAEWCGPCRMVAPILDDIAQGYQGKLTVAKLNVDENREVPAKFGIRGIPTLMLFKDGQLAATKVGALNKAQLTAFIDEQLT
jgi:thioredoxin 1